MKSLLITFVAVFSFIVASAQDADKIKELEQRVQRLEEQMARIDSRSANSQKMMAVARKHMNVERANFNAEDIQKAEELYIKASKLMREGKDSKTLLDSVVLMYPQLNRAGCAQLYRAQQESDQEKERLLKDCIEHFSTCYYGDGAQVGPLATYQLASYYRQTGREHDARKLFRQLRYKNPEAVGHDGELLVNEID